MKKRWVASDFQNVDNDCADITSVARLFRICGPTDGKDRLETADSLSEPQDG